MSKTCRQCDWYLPKISECLQYRGLIGIEKMKKALSFGGCDSFKPITVKQTQTKAG